MVVASGHRAFIAFRALLALAALLAVVLPGTRGVAASADWNGAPWPLEHLEVVRQSQPASCGPASLATLATWLGRPHSEAQLLEGANVTPSGVTLAEFTRLAHAINLPGTWYAVPTADLGRLPTPFVAHLHAGPAEARMGHLVVVAAVSHGYVVVGDPASGAYVSSVAAFARRFSGRVYLLDGAA
jgi:predicted double-glycine peptidase